eukprot:CAMPEP_0172633658 /NCGR_PEP_ID=MMETSP1068-20121228/190604_1 /TAXON_ID=35684 /ORGANISM="Pseudopedinella elastica, Strain CCMP716" /LENGTH=174 /DNA_ID=CAMNT_0013445419 /DNA_START=99 /DNA_END=620 /DNA_ORIENTATION=-
MPLAKKLKDDEALVLLNSQFSLPICFVRGRVFNLDMAAAVCVCNQVGFVILGILFGLTAFFRVLWVLFSHVKSRNLDHRRRRRHTRLVFARGAWWNVRRGHHLVTASTRRAPWPSRVLGRLGLRRFLKNSRPESSILKVTHLVFVQDVRHSVPHGADAPILPDFDVRGRPRYDQ